MAHKILNEQFIGINNLNEDTGTDSILNIDSMTTLLTETNSTLKSCGIDMEDPEVMRHIYRDEATANIDTYTESLIQKSIEKLSREKSAIIIAHRLSTIVNVDKILVLDQGRIVESGNHSELVNSGGYYSKLYNAYYESLG